MKGYKVKGLIVNTQHTFNQSIFYSLKLRECPKYVDLYYEISQTIKNSPLSYKVKPTGLYSRDELKTIDEREYRLYRLTTENKLHYDFSKNCEYIELGFTSKYNLRAFLEDFHIDKKDVALCFYNEEILRSDDNKRIGTHGLYKIVLKILPTSYNSLKTFAKSLTSYTNHYAKSTYGKIRVYKVIHIASGIHDRWFDPFTFEKITDFNKVYQNFITASERCVNLAKILRICNAKTQHYAENQSKSVSLYISNLHHIDAKKSEIDLFSTSFYNKYLAEKNPYKISKFKKDWKFAAESFIKEIIGKYNYQLSRPKCIPILDDYNMKEQLIKDGFYFSKENFDAELAHKISHLQREIKSAEWDVEFFSTNIKHIEESWDLSKWTKTDDPIDALFGYTETEKYQNCKKKLDEAKKDIDRYQSSLRFYTGDYTKRYKEIHNKRDQLFNKLYGLVFSKREVSLFLDSLKLHTKICAHKFRKIILDALVELGMLSTNGIYDRFHYICIRYIFNKEIWKKMLSLFTYQKTQNSTIYLQGKYNIKLENHLLEKSSNFSKTYINNIEITKQFAPRSEYFGPPD